MDRKSIFQRFSRRIEDLNRELRIGIIAVSSPGHYTLWNALAAESLAGDLRGHFGDKAKVLILRVRTEYEYDAALLSLQNATPDILGVSVECGGVELATVLVEEFLGKLRRNMLTDEAPDLLFGGKIPSYCPDYFLTKFPSSIVVIGEGEIPLRRIVQRYFSEYPEPLAKIPNLAYICETGNLLRSSAIQPSSSSLIYPPSTDTVPDLLSMGAGTLMVQASRGCSWSKCSYCTVQSFRGGKKWEPLPWSRTKKHLESLVSLGVREFEFCDDEFLGGRAPEHLERVRAIADDLSILKKAFVNGIAFRIFLTPHSIFHSDDTKGNEEVVSILRQMKKAGLARVYFGIESGSEAQLMRYCRGTTLGDVVGALDVVRSLGIGVDCGFIMFDPLVTLDDIAENIRFFRKHGLVEHNQWPFRPLVANRGATVGRIMDRSGITPTPEFMSYRYNFKDQQVQWVYNIVDAISSETRVLFYALKVLSKAHFDPAAETCGTKKAKHYVVQNAKIYIDLMDKLLGATSQTDSDFSASAAALNARHCIMQLVVDIAADIESGCLEDVQGRLREEVHKLLPQFVRLQPHRTQAFELHAVSI